MTNNPRPATVRQASPAPTNKAVAATGGSALGGAIAIIVIHGLEAWTGGKIDADLAGAITTLVGTFVAGAGAYFVPPGARDDIVITPSQP